MISDATGETLIAVGRAAAVQYVNHRAVEHIYPMIRSCEQLDKVIQKIALEPGIVLHTILDEALSKQLEQCCNEMGVPAVSVIEPVLTLFQSYLGEKTSRRASAQHVMNDEYFRRIEALNYTMDHDDGLLVEGLSEADVILVGVSRASKTQPASILPIVVLRPPIYRLSSGLSHHRN